MPAAEALALISSVASTAKTLAEAVGKLREKPQGNKEANEVLAQAQELAISVRSGILDLQETVLQLREEKAELQEQLRQSLRDNDGLRQQIRAKESRAQEREQYERKKIRDTWVIVPKGQEEPPFCPACYANDRLVTLAALGRSGPFGVNHLCPSCQATYKL